MSGERCLRDRLSRSRIPGLGKTVDIHRTDTDAENSVDMTAVSRRRDVEHHQSARKRGYSGCLRRWTHSTASCVDQYPPLCPRISVFFPLRHKSRSRGNDDSISESRLSVLQYVGQDSWGPCLNKDGELSKEIYECNLDIGPCAPEVDQ